MISVGKNIQLFKHFEVISCARFFQLKKKTVVKHPFKLLSNQLALTDCSRNKPPCLSATALDEWDSADGEYEDYSIGTKEDLPPLSLANVTKLENAFQKGRRQAPIKKLAGDCNLMREDVILWMKLRTLDPSMATETTVKPRRTIVMRSDRASSGREKGESELKKKPEEGKEFKWWENKENWGNKLTRANIDTLNRVFKDERYPSGEMIGDIQTLTKLPRKKIIEWFGTARRAAMADKHGPLDGEGTPKKQTKRRWY